MGKSPDTVESLLMKRMEKLTPSERSVANLLLKDYPVSGLLTITEIAEQTGVSTPSVLRMCRKLGFDGFAELQKEMRQEVTASLKDPMKKLDAWHSDNDLHLVSQFSNAISSNVRHTLQRLDIDVFDAVAKLLADPKKKIYITGGRITRSIADHLFNHLQIIRPNVTHLGTSANIWPQHVVDMDKNSVVFIFDIRRYESELAKLAKLSDDKKADVVLMTDQWGSPIGHLSRYKFNALVEVPSSWDSMISILFLVETLIASVQEHCGKTSKSRIEALETMFYKTSLFNKLN